MIIKHSNFSSISSLRLLVIFVLPATSSEEEAIRLFTVESTAAILTSLATWRQRRDGLDKSPVVMLDNDFYVQLLVVPFVFDDVYIYVFFSHSFNMFSVDLFTKSPMFQLTHGL